MGGVEPDPQRERDSPSQRNVEREWSPYDEAAAAEDAEWRKGRRRRLLLGLGVALLVICVVGSVVGYILYDRATKVDRSTPAVVVLQYVNAIFDERDLAKAESFECDSSNGQLHLRALLNELEDLERKFNVRVTVSVADFKTDIRGSNAAVNADLLIDVPEEDGDPSRARQSWNFELEDMDGWRVCQAVKQDS